MDKDTIVKKLNKENGRAKKLAKAIIDCEKSSWSDRDRYEQALDNLLMGGAPGGLPSIWGGGKPKDLLAIFDNGPDRLFKSVHGDKVADIVSKLAARMGRYVHSQSTYRRSFRTTDPAPYAERFRELICELLFFSWERYDLPGELTTPPNATGDTDTNDEKTISFPYQFFGDYIALCIDEGDPAVINAIKEICLGDNNTKLLSDPIINGMLKSSSAEMHKLLGDMLLAAKLQEGLRQSILENADNGTVEAFTYLMKLVIDHDLIRYSSALRAVDVWMGMDEGYEDKRTATKMLTLGYTYLTDRKALDAGLTSEDQTRIYVALWALSVAEMADTEKPLKQLLAGEKYQKLTGLYFLAQTENPDLQFSVTSEIIRNAGTPDFDLDILSLALVCYPVNNYIPWHRDNFSAECRENRFLADKKIRDGQFESLLHILHEVPQKGYSAEGKPFAWCSLSLSPSDICTRLFNIAGWDFEQEKTGQLIDIMPLANSDSRCLFIELFLKSPANSEERAFLFAALNDKSMSVRKQALENLLAFTTQKNLSGVLTAQKNHSDALTARKNTPGALTAQKNTFGALTDDEVQTVADLLALKTGDIRQNCVKLLLAMTPERSLETIKKLLADKNENRRLGGLDMLTRLVNDGEVSKTDIPALIATMPEAGSREQILIRAISAEEPRYCKENGFGLYDSGYRPELAMPVPDARYTLDSVLGVSPKRMTELFDSLCALIKEHRDYTYQIDNYEGVHDVKLGGLTWPAPRADADDDRETDLDRFVLQDVWRGWMRDRGITFAELFYLNFATRMTNYDGSYEPEYADWAEKSVKKLFHVKDVGGFIRDKNKKEYGELASSLLNILWTEFPESERFAVLSSLMSDVMKRIPENDWTKDIDNGKMYIYNIYQTEDTFVGTSEVHFILNELEDATTDDGRFAEFTALCFELGRLSGMYYCKLGIVGIARAVTLGIIKEDALMRTLFLADTANMNYAGKIRWEGYREDAERYPVLKTCADKAAARVIEIELDRGDSPTEVSKLAAEISWHEGAETFVHILTALGSETFVRGYIWSSEYTKKAVLSSLLKVSHPGEDDSDKTLRGALEGKNIKDKRLIEAAMYAPAWLDIVGDCIGWSGFKSAAWYFHAHINETFSAEKETEVARYSPISPEDFRDGAFDISWFREAYDTLGEERFGIVYDCAKYLTSGSNHRRAQLFADAVSGRLNKVKLASEIKDKRNKDKLLSYSLIPLAKAGAADTEVLTAALERYEFIQQFLKESKGFGAQRRESEAKVCAIAQGNLARNAGFADALRFAWRMEMLKIEEVKSFFEPVACGDYSVQVKIADDGSASVVCEKDGKKLASIPSALKKDEHVVDCKGVVASLKDQYKRARASLEKAMVNCDVFEYGEIKTLMDHPVVAPMLAKLVFVSVNKDGAPQKSGAFCELKGLKDQVRLRIAHPYDLFTLGSWTDCQRAVFERKLIQPFKQVFRELYLINEDEKREKTVSRRYAGHQVQPQKTVALLKGRGWTVDYENGLQRVYYKEDFYATVFAAADWFSPADTEAPTLETVQFFPRRITSSADPAQLDLGKIPPVVFSEVMRDLDLVVSVAHVGGVDPEASHSTVEMRAAIVRELLELLHIDNVVIEDRHATIQGSLGEYTVHLGSAQVHKMGRGAVNILAVPGQHRGRVFLPFADDDPRTAEVMSKIILLADDKSIKDPAILSQIG